MSTERIGEVSEKLTLGARYETYDPSDLVDGNNVRQALLFFLELLYAPVPRIAVENPKSGILNHAVRRPDQTIHPWYFGEAIMKRTCLWLRKVPPLQYRLTPTLFGEATATDRPSAIYVERTSGKKRHFTDAMSSGPRRAQHRSRTAQALANAMAAQWGGEDV